MFTKKNNNIMLNRTGLRERVLKRISEISDEEMLRWLEFDQQREIMSHLLNGENVAIPYKIGGVINASIEMVVPQPTLVDMAKAGEYSFAMAA